MATTLITATLASRPSRAEMAVALPAQPEGTPWPHQSWPEQSRYHSAAEPLLDQVFGPEARAPLRGLRAFLVVKNGKISAERYRTGFDQTTRFPSWSMAKSVVHALTGVLMRQGRIDISAPAPVAIWHRNPADPRSRIRIEDLLRMQSGLVFRENYTDPAESHVLQMLFGIGRADTGGYAQALPLAHPPGTHWSYSSGNTNIITGFIRTQLGITEASGFRALMQEALFSPLSLHSAVPEFDARGTFIGSSYLHMTARDWARFGLLYLRDGMWDDKRILPEGWADHARTPARHSGGRYGAHFWLNLPHPETGKAALSDAIPRDMFMARGFGGQMLVIVPSHDLLLVGLGVIYDDDPAPLVQYVADMIRIFADPDTLTVPGKARSDSNRGDR